MEEFSYQVQIPKKRIGALIGKKGAAKKKIESLAKVKIKVSPEGRVEIKGNDSLLAYLGQKVVEAIGYGSDVQTACQLFDEGFALEVVELGFLNKKSLRRVKGIIIGTNGKTKKKIEELTGTKIFITDKTITIIGETEKAFLAKQAVEMFLNGAKHGSVYYFIEKKRKENP